MTRNIEQRIGNGWICCAMMVLFTHSAYAQRPTLATFRLDTDVYSDVTKPPIKRTLTLFSEGVFYDLDREGENGQRITVIDPRENRIILLDRNRQLQTVLKMDDILKVVNHSREQMSPQQSDLLAAPKISQDPQTNELVVGNASVEYRCQLITPPSPDIAAQYAEFADWSARLNAVDPPYFPPFLRLELDQVIAARGAIPQDLHRIAKKGRKESNLTAKLLPNWRLSSDDQALIARIGTMLVQFKSVSKQDFQKQEKSKSMAAE